jgi:beta-galactosidase/beta-glucuronidase
LPVAHRADLKLTIKGNSDDQVAEHLSQVNIPPGASRFSYHITIPSPQRWTCQNPSLYRLKTEVFDPLSNELDVQETSFGMREFTMREGQFYLNGELVYIRGVLLQPDYPISLVTPPDPKMMEREIRLVKEAGFNLIRIHLRPAAPGFLDLADEMGILVYAETSLGWIKDSPRLMDHDKGDEALIRRFTPSFFGAFITRTPRLPISMVRLYPTLPVPWTPPVWWSITPEDPWQLTRTSDG